MWIIRNWIYICFHYFNGSLFFNIFCDLFAYICSRAFNPSKKPLRYAPLFLFLISLNLLQCYQIQKGILTGGATTAKEYWSHFLQWKTNAPTVAIKKSWKKIYNKHMDSPQSINASNHLSKAMDSDSLSNVKSIVIELEIGAKHGDPNISLVLSSLDGAIYQSFNFGDYLYKTPRKMSLKFDVPEGKRIYRTYIWNGDTDSEAEIRKININYYSY